MNDRAWSQHWATLGRWSTQYDEWPMLRPSLNNNTSVLVKIESKSKIYTLPN